MNKSIRYVYMTLVILGTIGMISTVGMAEDKNVSAETFITFNWIPNPPSNLLQYALNGAIALPFGGTTKANVFIASGIVGDPDPDMVLLEVEVEPVGIPFMNIPNCQSTLIVYPGSVSNAECYGLTSGNYHWQARAVDEHGAQGNWVSAGGNLESSSDIIINYIPDRLNPGDSLKIGQSITSTNGKFKLTLQADGNLVLSSSSQVIWTAGISGRGGVVAVMQTDGNFIVYSSSGAIWYTNTQGTGAYMVIQNDGNAVIYNQNYQALWKTKIIPSIRVTSPNGGEKWKHGTVHTIKWTSVGNPGANVKIELLRGTKASPIAISAKNTGSYSWKIPSGQTPGTNYKIRITSSNSAYKDTSNNNFIIIT